MLRLYLDSKPTRENSFSTEFIRVLSYSKKTTQASQTVDSYRIYSDVMNLILAQKIMHIKAQLNMITILYCYDGFEPNDDEDDRHVDDVVEEDGLGEPIN